jgi:D-arabinose 1-dehydrogenase-like Zn-dependent alcohol dehydrogenase
MAVQVAKHLGASHVIGAGRQPERLATLVDLGADVTVSLEGDPAHIAHNLGQAARDVDVVIDYLWGEPTADAMLAVIMNRTDRAKLLTWIEIGSVAGLTAAIPSALLRAARLQIVGSGIGSVSAYDILLELPELVTEITNGTFKIEARAVSLVDIETAWKDTSGSQRIVITP